MKKEDVKEVILQILELQLDSQLRAIRCLQGKPEAEAAFHADREEDVSLWLISRFKYLLKPANPCTSTRSCNGFSNVSGA